MDYTGTMKNYIVHIKKKQNVGQSPGNCEIPWSCVNIYGYNQLYFTISYLPHNIVNI